MTTKAEVVHSIVNHLPLNPADKDKLLEKVTEAFGEESEEDPYA